MELGMDRGYLPKPAKYLFITDNPEEKEASKRKFDRAGLNLKYIDDSQYLGAYLGLRGELEEWLWLKLEEWAHGVRTLAKIVNWYPQ